jgi:hypothetical protein
MDGRMTDFTKGIDVMEGHRAPRKSEHERLGLKPVLAWQGKFRCEAPCLHLGT